MNATNLTFQDVSVSSLRTGDLFATTVSAGTVSATSFYGDGSNLTGIVPKTGGTFTGDITVARADGQFKIQNGAGSNEMQLVVTRNTGQVHAALRISGNSQQYALINTSGIDVTGNATFSGNVTATAFYGDGSNLTGVASAGTSATLETRIATVSSTFAATSATLRNSYCRQ